jgi:hypothetical protein
MVFLSILQNVEDLYPWERHLEADFAQFGVFGCHVFDSPFGVLSGFRYDNAALDFMVT